MCTVPPHAAAVVGHKVHKCTCTAHKLPQRQGAALPTGRPVHARTIRSPAHACHTACMQHAVPCHAAAHACLVHAWKMSDPYLSMRRSPATQSTRGRCHSGAMLLRRRQPFSRHLRLAPPVHASMRGRTSVRHVPPTPHPTPHQASSATPGSSHEQQRPCCGAPQRPWCRAAPHPTPVPHCSPACQAPPAGARQGQGPGGPRASARPSRPTCRCLSSLDRCATLPGATKAAMADVASSCSSSLSSRRGAPGSTIGCSST
jgi:hypothetical protein